MVGRFCCVVSYQESGLPVLPPAAHVDDDVRGHGGGLAALRAVGRPEDGRGHTRGRHGRLRGRGRVTGAYHVHGLLTLSLSVTLLLGTRS